MNALRRLKLLIALAGLCACCAHPAAPAGGPTPVGTFVHCSGDAATHAGNYIVGEVTTALITGNYAAELADLAKRFGAEEVSCAVDLVVAEFNVKAARSNDKQVALVLQHARAWRKAQSP